MIGRALRELRSATTTFASPADWFRQVVLGGQPTHSGVLVTPEAALAHGDVFACVRVLSEDAGSLPLVIYEGPVNAPRVVTTSPTARSLARPAPGVTTGQLIATTVAHLNAWGNAFWLKVPAGIPGQFSFYMLHPSRVAVKRAPDGEPIYNVSAGVGGLLAGTFGRPDILHFKSLSWDGVIGASPISQAREAIGVGIATEQYAGAFWANSAHPAGVIQFPEEMSDEAYRHLKESWQESHQGVDNAHKVAILEGGAKWQAIGLPMEDSQFIEQRKLSTLQVCRIFRVFPWMVGAASGDSMTYANVESQQLAHVKHSLRPWLVLIETTLRNDPDLFPIDAEIRLRFNLDELLRADSATRGNFYMQGVGRWMTQNEIRERENLEALEGGDALAPIQGLNATMLEHFAPGGPADPLAKDGVAPQSTPKDATPTPKVEKP